MGFIVRLLARLISVLVLVSALVIGWFASHEQGTGVLFATIFPLSKGIMPATIVGHGKMKGVPAVPDDLKPQPRPENESFLELPGGHLMPQNGIGMCCRYSAYDDVLVRRTVLWYLLKGGRLIDTAHLYLNHHAVGLGIKDAMARGIPREEIFVTTKIFPANYGYNSTKTLVPTFLEDLGLEYIDLVLMHFPKYPFPWGSSQGCAGLSDKDCRAETYKALSELRDDGVMRNVGVSNFLVHQLEQLQSLNLAPVAVNQIPYTPFAPQEIVDSFEYCQKHGIAVTAYTSLGGALQHAQATTVETLSGLSKKYKVSVAQIMLRWAIQSNAAVIPGTGNPKHMDENLAINDFTLTPEEMASITALRFDEAAKGYMFFLPPADK